MITVYAYHRPGGSKIALVRLIVVLVSACVRTLACMQKLGGSGGMLLQEIFLNFGCCEMASEAILGPKTSLLIFALVLAW